MTGVVDTLVTLPLMNAVNRSAGQKIQRVLTERAPKRWYSDKPPYNFPYFINARHGYAVGWGTLSIVNAGFAEQKGRGKFSWLLLSFLFGPLATAFIVFSEPVPKFPATPFRSY